MSIHISYLRKNASFYRMLLFYLAMFLNACDNSDQITPNTPTSSPATQAQSVSTPRIIKLLFIYDGEKQTWVEEVTSQFNQARYQISDGQVIQVETIAMNSWQIIDAVLSENRQAHLLSPAADAFIKLGNTKSQLKIGQDLVGYVENLLLSPVVIAMWKPMAETLGWGKQQIGWADIVALAKKPQGWASYNYPQWGHFKLGHPHPEYSNHGLLSLFTQIYAATDKLADLTLTDLDQPQTRAYLRDIQQMVTHYGHSSHFVQQELLQNGPTYLSAALLSENQVIQSYQQPTTPFPIVAIYPKEGTLWSEHPIGIVEREWVTPTHQEAALLYIEYLRDKPQQEQALQYGFRPTNVQVPLNTPIDTAHGVDPKEPKVTLETPSLELMMAMLKLWHQQKKSANVVLLLDTSGSMRGDKIHHARDTILHLLDQLGDNDHFSLLSFNHRLNWVAENVPVGPHREKLQRQVKYQFPSGSTALYDALEQAHHFLITHSHSDKISIMLILTDGGDISNHLNLEELMKKITFASEQQPIRIFTIGYSSASEHQWLSEIAKLTHAHFYDGTVTPASTILKDIAVFF